MPHRAAAASHRPAAARRKQLRAWARLRVLCCSGLGAMAIAPDAFAVVREIVPNAAAALFLTAPDGTPRGFFHENSPESARRLFLESPHLFTGPDEHNVFRLIGDPAGRKVGQLMAPPPSHWRSNTFQLLVRASGHQHSLDARLEPAGVRSGLVSLFREPGAGFDEDDRLDMARVAMHFEHAMFAGGELDPAAGAPPAVAVPPGAVPQGEAMLVCSPEGRLLHASAPATEWLAQLPLAGAAWPDRRVLPPFCLRLLEVLRSPQQHPWRLPGARLPVPGGELHASAQWLVPPQAEGADPQAAGALVGIVLRRLTPRPLQVWRRLAASGLSPQQLEVGYWLALGGGRDAVRAHMDIGEAVLRDCVKAVYAEFGCAGQAEYAAAL